MEGFFVKAFVLICMFGIGCLYFDIYKRFKCWFYEQSYTPSWYTLYSPGVSMIQRRRRKTYKRRRKKIINIGQQININMR